MAQQWPPSPSVEDEEIALAKECGLTTSSQSVKNENQPAPKRGSIDQYPIILDGDAADADPNGRPTTPATATADPPSARERQRESVRRDNGFGWVSPQPADPHLAPRPDHFHRSKSTTQLGGQDVSRGRPPVTRINTDLGGDLAAMITGARRAPSPYAHKSSTLADASSRTAATAGDGLLSPLRASERSHSTSRRPRPTLTSHDSSDSDQKSRSSRSAARSRSRAPRHSLSRSERSDSDGTRAKRSTGHQSPQDAYPPRRHRQPSLGPSRRDFVNPSYGQDHITPPRTPKPNGAPSRSPASVESVGPRLTGASDHRQCAKRVVSDSPYHSSAEDGPGRHLESGDERRRARDNRSRRSSRSYAPQLDYPLSDRTATQRRDRHSKDETSRDSPSVGERARRDYPSPTAMRTPKAMEDYFEKAFLANQVKDKLHARSRATSPLVSPLHSPPRTPRGDRTPRDFFEPASGSGSGYAKTTKARSRPPSFDDTHLKDVKLHTSLLGAATLGASLAAKTASSVPRSHMAPSELESPSSGSQSRPSSGPRSRKPSPVAEDRRKAPHPTSRNKSTPTTRMDDSKPARPASYGNPEDRKPTKPTTLMPGSPAESGRPILRAASYSYAPEHARPTAPHRSLSTAATDTLPQSFLNGNPANFAASPTVMEATTTLPHSQPLSASLPACPRSRPVAGLHDWYTIRELPGLDFCPSCMGVLGATRFRDHFVPSLPKDPRRRVSCAMSMPWLHLAWEHALGPNRRNLDLVVQVASSLTPGAKQCPGAQVDYRRWYYLTDPRTQRPVENFQVCSACVRNMDLIFPSLRYDLFDRPHNSIDEDRVCSLHQGSRHFAGFVLEVERMAEAYRQDPGKSKSILDLVDFTRRISRHRECSKDAMLRIQSWHFVPSLPEFTICEECYDLVVFPRRDLPIARDVSMTQKIVPTLRRTTMLPGISCQLYSERMRKVFADAVRRNDWHALVRVAKHRYNLEHDLQELAKLYEQDAKAGIDRSAERETIVSRWRAAE